MRELDGVGQQVSDNLGKPLFVTDDDAGNLVIDIHGDVTITNQNLSNLGVWSNTKVDIPQPLTRLVKLDVDNNPILEHSRLMFSWRV